MATGPAVLAAGLIPLALLSPGPLAQLVAGLVVAGVGAAEGATVITVPALGPGGLLAGWNVATPLVIGPSLAGTAAVLILQNADTRRRVATEEPA